MSAQLPSGSWPTPVTADLVIQAARTLSGVALDGDAVYWSEMRPADGGRTQVVRLEPGGTPTDVLPEGSNARTQVHEYGGGAWWVRGGVVWYVEWSDQRLRRIEPGGRAGRAHPRVARGWLGALGQRRRAPARRPAGRRTRDAPGGRRTRSTSSTRSSCSTPTAGRTWWSRGRTSSPTRAGRPTVTRSPGWSGTTRRCRGTPRRSRCRTRWASSPWPVAWTSAREGICQPRWAPDGSLWFCSDRDDWWSLYRWTPGDRRGAGVRRAGRGRGAEVGLRPVPLRVPRGRARRARGPARGARLPAPARRDGRRHASRDRRHRGPDAGGVRRARVALVGSSPVEEPAVRRFAIAPSSREPGPVETLSAVRDLGIGHRVVLRARAHRVPRR